MADMSHLPTPGGSGALAIVPDMLLVASSISLALAALIAV